MGLGCLILKPPALPLPCTYQTSNTAIEVTHTTDCFALLYLKWILIEMAISS